MSLSRNMIFYFIILILTMTDIFLDYTSGVSFKHILVQFGVLFVSLFGFNYYLDLVQKSSRLKIVETLKSEEEKKATQSEIINLKQELLSFKNQFRFELESQFKKWKLTSAESEVAIYLLKGLSLKEISEARNSNEKTVRSQCTSIYRKSELKGRSQFSSYFLDFIV